MIKRTLIALLLLGVGLGGVNAATKAILSVNIIAAGNGCLSGSLCPSGPPWVVAFDDEFPGTSLNMNNWAFIGEGGWPEDCSRYLSVNNGLTLKDTLAGDGTACALTGLPQFGFGYYEVNMMNDPDGLSEFWTESNGNHVGNPIDSGFEADIYETVGNSQNLYWSGYTSTGAPIAGWHSQSNGHLPGADGKFHLYGMDFEPTGVTFYADGLQTGNYPHTFSSPGAGEWLIISNLYQGSIAGADPGSQVKWARVYHH